jgi:hypothetical protein
VKRRHTAPRPTAYYLLAHAVLSVRVLTGAPLTPDTGAWYFWNGAGPVLVLLALAAYACYTATGARLFKEGFFGDD